MYCVSSLSSCSALAPMIAPSEFSFVLRMEDMTVKISSDGVVTTGWGLPLDELPERAPGSAVSVSVIGRGCV